VFELGIPVLGICYGMQTMAQQLGGKVMTAEAAGKAREFGYSEVRAHGHTALLKDIADFTTAEGHGMLKVWMSHGDSVMELPAGFKIMASTASCPIAGMADEAASSTPSSSTRKSPTPCRAGPSSNASCMASAAAVPTG
jgi:GMP synthase (glutamine-hydrolysing)